MRVTIGYADGSTTDTDIEEGHKVPIEQVLPDSHVRVLWIRVRAS